MAVILGLGLDDDLSLTLRDLARGNNFEFLSAASPDEAEAALGIYACDLLIARLDSAHKDTWPQLTALSSLPGSPDLIAAVPGGDTAAAEFAIQSGCWDVLYLPSDRSTLFGYVQRCLESRRSAQEKSPTHLKRDEIIGSSPLLGRLLQQLGVYAASDSSVLIMGETGTGKELFAKAIHDNSPRADKPMIVVDCTNLPASLAESLLFGHARGSFTGAVEATDGLFKQADGGTIFLDEIGELDISVQKSLLRVIQEKRFRPLSAKKEISCDFRIIAATNQDLESMVQQGSFRQDLYHRINTQTVILPPLRDRAEDVPMLMRHYVDLFCNSQNLPPKEIAPEALEGLKLYNWPGNIRELVNVAHLAALRAQNDQHIYLHHLSEEIRLFLARSQISTQELMKKAGENGELLIEAREASALTPLASTLEGNFGAFELAAAAHSEIEQTDLPPEIEEQTASTPPQIWPEARPEIQNQGHPSETVSAVNAAETVEAATGIQTGQPEQVKAPGELFAATAAASPNSLAEASAAVYNFAARSHFPSYKEARAEYVSKMERHYIADLLRRSQGNFEQARALSGLSRARLYELLKRNRSNEPNEAGGE